MTSLPADQHARLDTLLQQIGLELAFVDAEQENGIEVARELVQQFVASLGDDAPEVIRQAADAAQRWLEERAAADGRFTAETIAAFNSWQPWLAAAVTAWAHGRPCAAMPAELSSAATPGAATQATPAVPAIPPAAASPAVPTARLPEGPFEDQHVEIAVKADDAELMRLFCADAHDLLQEIEQGVLVLEANPRDDTALNTLFRAFHTFKGNVGVMKLIVLQQLTHELESLLDAARRGTFHLARDSFDVVLAGADVLKRFVEELTKLLDGDGKRTTVPLPIPRIIAHLRALLTRGRTAGVPAQPTASAPPAGEVPTPRPTAPTPAATAATPAPNVSATPAPVESTPPAAPLVAAPKADGSAADRKNAQRSGAGAGTGIVRVDTLKLDSLIDLVGELVIAQSMVVQNTAVNALADGDLSRTLGQLRGITSDLQRTAMSLRMVPIRGTFQKMSRLVRDLSIQQDKDIRLVLHGEDTELDRTLVEELNDPLIHMIRNSADHGIEPAASRAAAGKPVHGTITLRAFHQGGFIVIQITDDGRGLSPERIRAKAIERGLIRAEDHLDEESILELIFAPGFSTAEQVTDLSGRGVGMDVVRRNIEKMRGKIEIQSDVGRGTTFTISMPLTLAIIEGLLVGVGEQRYIVPTLAVRESFRPLPGMVSTVQGRGEVVSVRGKLTPMLRLGAHLNTEARAEDPTQGIVVVVESGQDCRCLFVDELIGKQEVVIKSLGDVFRDQTEFAGAAILGDGRVGLILDVNSLVKMKPRNDFRNGETAA